MKSCSDRLRLTIPSFSGGNVLAGLLAKPPPRIFPLGPRSVTPRSVSLVHFILLRALRFIPAIVMGLFVAAPGFCEAPQPQVEILLDVSGSMTAIMRGGSRMALAKQALLSAVEGIPPGTSIGVRAFAHRYGQEAKEKSCIDSELLLPIEAREVSEIAAAIKPLKPTGFTPLAYSLRQVRNDFRINPARKVIILLSDGADSCDGDPTAEILELKSAGFDVQVQAIGIEPDPKTRAELAAIAAVSGGQAYAISSIDELNVALTKAFQSVAQPAPLVASIDQSSVKRLTLGENQIEFHGPLERFEFDCAEGEKFSIQFKAHGVRQSQIQLKLKDGGGKIIASLSGVAGESDVVQTSRTGGCQIAVLGMGDSRISLAVRKLVGF